MEIFHGYGYRNTQNPWVWIGILKIVKMLVFSILIYRFDAILVKLQQVIFVDFDKLILKLGGAKTQNCQDNIKRTELED